MRISSRSSGWAPRVLLGVLAVIVLACGRPTHEIDLEVRNAEDDRPIVGAEVIVAGRSQGRAGLRILENTPQS